MADAVRETADRLYGLPPQRFVAERAAAVAAAREAGDADAAAALRRLRRPTVAAWLVNLLALRRPELLADLVELASALRTAQRELDGGQLRELTNQRRAAVSALVATARSLAVEVEPSLAGGKLPLAEVETTLAAALGDAAVAEQVRSGRLVRAVAPEGFGELPRARLRLVTGGGDGDGDAEPELGEADQATRDAVVAALAEARAAAADANAALAQASAVEQDAKQALAQVDAELAELTARRGSTAGRLAEAEAASLDARRAVATARRRVGEVEAAAAALAAADAADNAVAEEGDVPG